MYARREEELVLLGSVPLIDDASQIIPPPRAGSCTTEIELELICPGKFSQWQGKSTVSIKYTFVPKQVE